MATIGPRGGLAIAYPQSNWKPSQSDEEPVYDINSEVWKNCTEGLQTSHTRLPKNAILIDTKADGSCHLGPGWTHETHIWLNWLILLCIGD